MSKRFGLHDQLTLNWRTTSGESVEASAQLVNLSEGGLALRLDTNLAVGQWVEVSGMDGKADAQVRYCQPEGTQFLLGLQTYPAGHAEAAASAAAS